MDYSKFDANLIVTCSADKTVAVWDCRNMKSKLFVMKGHKDEATSVRFSSYHPNLIASAAQDRRVNIWDLSRIGQPQTEEEKLNGPPELLF